MNCRALACRETSGAIRNQVPFSFFFLHSFHQVNQHQVVPKNETQDMKGRKQAL